MIDVDGTLANDPQTGLDEALVEDLLKKVKPENQKYDNKGGSGLEPPKLDYSKKFAAALKAIKAGDWKAAAVELAKLEKEPAPDGDNAKSVSKWIEEQGAKKIEDGDDCAKADDFFGARDAYAEVEKKWPTSSEAVKNAKDKLAALKKDKDSDSARVLAQEKNYTTAQTAEGKGDKAKAIAFYQKCADGCVGTKFAQKCKDKVAALSK